MTEMPMQVGQTSLEDKILLIRGQKVILDSVLAELYGTTTGRLNEQVKRNGLRFPPDFMFQLTRQEFTALISQNAISKRGGRRNPPYAFSEQGVAMLSSVLTTERAIKVNISIVRTFVRMREILLTNEGLSIKLEALERKYDSQFQVVFDAIRQLMKPRAQNRRRIGFTPE